MHSTRVQECSSNSSATSVSVCVRCCVHSAPRAAASQEAAGECCCSGWSGQSMSSLWRTNFHFSASCCCFVLSPFPPSLPSLPFSPPSLPSLAPLPTSNPPSLLPLLSLPPSLPPSGSLWRLCGDQGPAPWWPSSREDGCPCRTHGSTTGPKGKPQHRW